MLVAELMRSGVSSEVAAAAASSPSWRLCTPCAAKDGPGAAPEDGGCRKEVMMRE